jgi:pimeloyl-ACP methyl ester carboxylesterase
VLAGHSNGTPVVRQFYRRFPDRTAGLIAVDGPLRQMFTSAELGQFVADIQGKDSREKITGFLDGMLRSDMDPKLRQRILDTMLATPRHVMADSLAHSGDQEIWAEDPIEVPLLVVVADSPFWTGAYENFVHVLAPGVDYRTFRGTGHFVMIDDPGGFNDAVLEFLDAHRLLAEPRS